MKDEAEPELAARSRAVSIFHNRVTAWVILACGIGMTAAAWCISSTSVQRRAEERFAFRTTEIQHAIEDRMNVYEQVLWGGVGIFNASETLTRDEWRRYVEILDLDEHWPGIQGIGFSVPVSPADKLAHIQQIREEGFPEYTISPPGERAEYSAIVYLEPFDWRNQRAFGFDMWSNKVRRAAMTRARDTGQAATSGVTTLVQETDDDVQRGFLTYLPVYEHGAPLGSVEERRRAFVGWVYSAFRMGDLMAGILASGEEEIGYEIFDGSEITEASLLFDSDERFEGAKLARGGIEGWFTKHVSLESGGREWTLVFAADAQRVMGAEAGQPALVAIGGVIIDLLLFYVITSLALLQKRASRIADAMTVRARAAHVELAKKAAELEQHAESLERSNDELRQFAFAASHDLQEPLRAVASFSGLLKETYAGQFDETGNRWLEHLVSGAERMSTLIRDLLSYTKVDSAERADVRVSLDLALNEALENLGAAIEETGAQIEIASLPSVSGDPAQLTQLFQNLVGNSIKYRSEERAPVIQIGAEETSSHWRVWVRDNGIGVKRDYHQRIFEIFRRIGARNKESGTGIGLAICRRVVERHGGEIGIESRGGVGSTFWFTLSKTHEGGGNNGQVSGSDPDR